MLLFLLVVISVLWQCSTIVFAEADNVQDVRPSILAGRWYPESPPVLSKRIEAYLSRAISTRLNGKLTAVIVPHAGHMYSGQVAAQAYRLLTGRQYRRIVLLGPSHQVRFRGVSVNLQSGYETPLGIVPVDRNLGRRLLDAGSDIRWLREAHVLEHSLEIQLPFLQKVLGNFQIVPILMGQQDYRLCSNLARTLKQVLGDTEDTLILASSDLSHFYTYDQAKTLDFRFITRVRAFDPKGLAEDLSMGKCEACGGGPVITTLLTAQNLGADRAIILGYANSGDVTGDHRRVVGYLSAALVKSSDRGPHQ
jgi:AmmeMemoRadiSam system protein B